MENVAPLIVPLPHAGTEAAAPIQDPLPSVRVWLVDDNDHLRIMLAELLGRCGGIECVRHFSSPEALLSALASKPGPDVILLDVQMGGHNGLDAVRPIKSLTRSTRVLMFTACSSRDMRERAFCEGASDYLLKSQTLDYVAARIRNPAGDPAPRLAPRRRASCPPEGKWPGEPAGSGAGRVSRLLRRTLKALRVF